MLSPSTLTASSCASANARKVWMYFLCTDRAHFLKHIQFRILSANFSTGKIRVPFISVKHPGFNSSYSYREENGISSPNTLSSKLLYNTDKSSPPPLLHINLPSSIRVHSCFSPNTSVDSTCLQSQISNLLPFCCPLFLVGAVVILLCAGAGWLRLIVSDGSLLILDNEIFCAIHSL